MAGGVEICRIRDRLPDDIGLLCQEAVKEGYTHLSRLMAEWENHTVRFDNAGECLYCATAAGTTIAVGGLTQDNNVPGALRVRRFYVSPAHRKTGLGQHLARSVLSSIEGPQILTCNAPTPGAKAFSRAVGFRDCAADHHNMTLTLPTGKGPI